MRLLASQICSCVRREGMRELYHAASNTAASLRKPKVKVCCPQLLLLAVVVVVMVVVDFSGGQVVHGSPMAV